MMDLFGYTFELNSFWKILVYCILVFFVSWIISRFVRYLLIIFIKRKKSSEQYGITRLKFIKNSVTFFIGLIAFTFIIYSVPQFKSKATLIFSGAGILAAIIGFAAQAAVSNLIAGAFIVIFKPFRVGDYIRLDATRVGVVEDITLRHTVINNFENKRLIIPNSIISTESVLNHNIEDAFVLSFNNFLIGIHADIDKAKAIIREEALKQEYIIDNRTPEEVVQDKEQVEIRTVAITENGIQLRAYIWLNEPFNEFKLQCALREAVHKRFIDEDVEMPIPMRAIINS